MPGESDSLPWLLGGRYRLEAKLGHGGMGVVYRATDLTMKRPVAVKLIRAADGAQLDEEIAGRFLREAKHTARIQHEHIIEVFDLGRSESGDLFFVMELLEGESLAARMRREGKLAPGSVVHIAKQICDALHVAHAAGIIHRDLKPANVMLLSRAGDADYVKVLDFGVAKSYSSDEQTQLTHTGMLVGTVEYMAPEQIMGRKVDDRTDIYSLGVVLYGMLTGRPLFRDGGVTSLIHAHLNVSPRPLREVAPELPQQLDQVVLRALAKEPERRYPSMIELGAALQAAVRGTEPALPSLEYGELYEGGGDRTELVRPAHEDGAPEFDDETVKMEWWRPPSSSKKAPPPMDFGDRTAVMPREESSAKRPIPGVRDNFEPRACAMCQTVNAPHVHSCVACGISLAAPDQDAVRARVAAPRTAHMQAPQPPRVSGADQRSSTPPSGAPPPYVPPPQQQWAGAQVRAPSMWARFLAWTGLRGR